MTAISKGEDQVAGQYSASPVKAVFTPPKTNGLLWVTYQKDLEWFEFSARSYGKFAGGWDFAKCIVPQRDVEAFKPVCEANGIEIWGGDEWNDKPFNWHQTMKCYADVHLPGADVIFHCDADSVFGQKCSPADWVRKGKVLMPYRTYDSFLKRPLEPDEMMTFMGFTGKKADFNLGQYNWRFAVEFALGHRVERECMAWMPIAHRREVYEKTRQLITERFPKQKFDGYVRSCRDKFPQTFCEFNTLGAVANIYFEDYYEWWNLEGQSYPFSGKIIQSWSHGGLDREHDYSNDVTDKTINSPRKLFAGLGLLGIKRQKRGSLLETWRRFQKNFKNA